MGEGEVTFETRKAGTGGQTVLRSDIQEGGIWSRGPKITVVKSGKKKCTTARLRLVGNVNDSLMTKSS